MMGRRGRTSRMRRRSRMMAMAMAKPQYFLYRLIVLYY